PPPSPLFPYTTLFRSASIAFGGTKGNSLPGDLLRELAATIRFAAKRHDVGVIVLRSEGEGPFCAGASFDELKAIRNERAGKKFRSEEHTSELQSRGHL